MKLLRKPKRGEFTMGIDFTFEEMMVLAIFEEDNRSKSIDSMYEVLGEIQDDPEMEELLICALDKLERISDEEYLQIDFREYDQDVDALDEFLHNDEPAAAHGGDERAAWLDAGGIDFALPGGLIVEAYEGI